MILKCITGMHKLQWPGICCYEMTFDNLFTHYIIYSSSGIKNIHVKTHRGYTPTKGLSTGIKVRGIIYRVRHLFYYCMQ